MPGSVISGIFGNKAAKKQAKAATQAANAQIAFMEDALNVQQRNLLPDRIMGEQAMFAIADMLGLARPDTSLVLKELAPEGFGGVVTNNAAAVPAPPPPYASPYGVQPSQQTNIYRGQPYQFPFAQNPNAVRAGFGPYQPQRPQYSAPQEQPAQTVGDLVQLTPALPSGALAASPDYQFRLNEGLRVANTTAALSGMLQSGRQLKALTRYGQNKAAEEFNNRFERLRAIAGYGQTATNSTNNAVSNFGSNAGRSQAAGITAAGNARASGYQAMGDALSSIADFAWTKF